MIVGPDDQGGFDPTNGKYGAANKGFSQFNPYVLGSATFDLAIAGITTNSLISGVQVEFGTGTVTIDATPTLSTPEPSSALILGGLAVGLLGYRRLRR